MVEFRFPPLVLTEGSNSLLGDRNREYCSGCAHGGSNRESCSGCAHGGSNRGSRSGCAHGGGAILELDRLEESDSISFPQSPPDAKTLPECRGAPCISNPPKIIIGCDRRKAFFYDKATIKVNPPFSSVGRTVCGGGVGTGCLIANNFVLTAAHCVITNNAPRASTAFWQQGWGSEGCTFDEVSVTQAWIPKNYNSSNSKVSKCYDWAILRLATPTERPKLGWGNISADVVAKRNLYSVGYPGSLDKQMIPYWQGKGRLVGSEPLFSDPNGPGQLLLTDLDGEEGQSGGPCYVFQGGTRVIVGVMIGAPNCDENANWVTFLNDVAVKQIVALTLNEMPSDMVPVSFTAQATGKCS